MVSKKNSVDSKKIGFNRASRTDKGVHALLNLFSAKVMMDMKRPLEDYVTDINSNLPDSIRVFSLHRTSKTFSGRKFASHRAYDYYIPTFLFSPKSEVAFSIEDKPDPEQESEENKTVFSRMNIERSSLKDIYKYRIDDESLLKVQTLIRMFEGNNKYHNYTSKMKASDAKSYRYILKAKAYEKSVHNGIEYLRLTFKGQSFLYNQIRRMVGILYLVMHYELPDHVIKESMTSYQFHIPLAPAEGLMLNRVYTDHYNQKEGIWDVIEPWESKKQEIHDFRINIVNHI